MNHRLLAKYLGTVALLLGGAMGLSLPWALPAWGGSGHFETAAFLALAATICLALATSRPGRAFNTQPGSSRLSI